MIAIEVIRKKKRMEPILQKSWPVISEKIIYPPMVEEDQAQKLVFFGLMTYATVFESAILGTMSSSAAHYLARIQLGKCSLGETVERVVESTFSGFDSDDEELYADLFLTTVSAMIGKILAGDDDLDPMMQKLADGYRPVPLVERSR